jgi:CHAD domain-containing protein
MAKSRKPPAAVGAAAAVVAAGAAAAGGRLVRDRRARPAAGEPDRTYRLRTDEYVPDGIRRIARGRLADTQERLGGASRRDLDDAVHDTRKDLKRLRAALRLTRPVLGEETYDRENTTFRMAGRRLSGARDAHVLVETLDALTERFAADLEPAVTATLRERLAAEDRRASAALQRDDAAIARTLEELGEARGRTALWTLDEDGVGALSPGLRRIYRRGRKRLRAAAAQPSDEHLHEARKRVKDLWYATQLLRPAAPKRLKAFSKRTHRLADVLGDDHDLAVLADYVARHPQCFGDESARQALLTVLQRRRAALQRRAFELGGELYAQSPKQFVAAIERGWRKRAESHPAPLAG